MQGKDFLFWLFITIVIGNMGFIFYSLDKSYIFQSNEIRLIVFMFQGLYLLIFSFGFYFVFPHDDDRQQTALIALISGEVFIFITTQIFLTCRYSPEIAGQLSQYGQLQTYLVVEIALYIILNFYIAFFFTPIAFLYLYRFCSFLKLQYKRRQLLEKLIHEQISSNGEQGMCAICFIDFEQSQTIYKIICSHIFHKDCLERWLQEKLQCPYCRRNLQVRQ